MSYVFRVGGVAVQNLESCFHMHVSYRVGVYDYCFCLLLIIVV